MLLVVLEVESLKWDDTAAHSVSDKNCLGGGCHMCQGSKEADGCSKEKASVRVARLQHGLCENDSTLT